MMKPPKVQQNDQIRPARPPSVNTVELDRRTYSQDTIEVTVKLKSVTIRNTRCALSVSVRVSYQIVESAYPELLLLAQTGHGLSISSDTAQAVDLLFRLDIPVDDRGSEVWFLAHVA